VIYKAITTDTLDWWKDLAQAKDIGGRLAEIISKRLADCPECFDELPGDATTIIAVMSEGEFQTVLSRRKRSAARPAYLRLVTEEDV
jgi:hypothetical protein